MDTKIVAGLLGLGAVGYVTGFMPGTLTPWSDTWKTVESGNAVAKGVPGIHKNFINAAVFNQGPLANAKKK